MINGQWRPEFDPFASSRETLRCSVVFNPLAQRPVHLPDFGVLAKQFADPAWQEAVHSAIRRLSDAEAEDGRKSGDDSWRVLSLDGLPVYVVAAYVWVCVFFWLYALRVGNRGFDDFFQTSGLDPVIVATGVAGLCAKVCRRS